MGDQETFWVVIVVCTVFFVGLIYFLNAGIKLVRHAQVMIVERFGKYNRTLCPGLHFVTPIFEATRKVHWRYLDTQLGSSVPVCVSVTTDRIDMREHVIDFGRQHVITKDTVQVDVDALVYFRITDPRLTVFQIQNLPDAVELLTQATLRNIVAAMTLDDTFSSREEINSELLSKIQRDAERWGVTITRVEIFNILPPQDIKHAMENQIKSERERRSTVLQADGDRESAVIRSRGDAAKIVLQAEGARTSEILRAKGGAEAKVLIARADAECIQAIQNAVKDWGGSAVEYLTAVQYLNSLRNMTTHGKPDKVVLLPSECATSIDKLIRANTRDGK
jgi:regulator of protease activity HflC (stomatin/prohibitin superfamily)